MVKRGQTLRIIDSEGQQAVDALFYRADDRGERYSAQDTVRVQGGPYIGIGTELISNEGRVMMRVVADTCGLHDTSAGCCSCESNAVRFGEATKYQHACRENFVLELAKHGMAKRDIVSNVNFFMNVPIEPSGNFTVVDGISKPGDYVDLLAEHGRVVRHLQLPADQQPLQRLQSDAHSCGHLGSVICVADCRTRGAAGQGAEDGGQHHPKPDR